MKPVSDLTYKIVAFTEVPYFNTDECVDWAMEMITLGYENESILILASLTKPTNYFEAIEYLRASLKETGLTVKTGIEGTLCYSQYYITQLAKGINTRKNLSSVCNYCRTIDYESSIYDFYLLYWAWDDLDYGNTYQAYWPEANSMNIEEIVIGLAQKWLTENKISL